MTLQASGQISFADIAAEFNIADPVGFDDMYRGGGFVHDVTPNDSIPTTGAIDLGDFYGTGNDDISLTDGRDVLDDQAGNTPSVNAIAGFRFEPNGDIYEVRSTGDTLITADWLGTNRTGAGSDYEIRVEIYEGAIDTVNSDAVNTWRSMSVNRLWRAAATDTTRGLVPVTQEAKLKVFIRDRSNVVRASINPADPGGIGNNLLWRMFAIANKF